MTIALSPRVLSAFSMLAVLHLSLTINGHAQSVGVEDYSVLRERLLQEFQSVSPGHFGDPGPEVISSMPVAGKILALTFDACGGPTGSGFDDDMILWLHNEGIPATLFVTGSWADVHPDLVAELAADSLFDIENHGLNHCPCTVTGRSRYGISGTANVQEVIDEIESSARKIEAITGVKPIFYRSATASSDEGCAKIARALGEAIVGYSVLPGDGIAGHSVEEIRDRLLSQARDGAIVLMHMNRPERNTYEALRQAVPELKKRGYSFVTLRRGLASKIH